MPISRCNARRDEDNARAIRRLIDLGFLDRILLSQDVFIKMMLTHYGGFGYAYVVTHFVARLKRHGVTDEQITTMLIDNPRRVFSARMNSSGGQSDQEECTACRRKLGQRRKPLQGLGHVLRASPSIWAPSLWSRRSRTASST